MWKTNDLEEWEQIEDPTESKKFLEKIASFMEQSKARYVEALCNSLLHSKNAAKKISKMDSFKLKMFCQEFCENKSNFLDQLVYEAPDEEWENKDNTLSNLLDKIETQISTSNDSHDLIEEEDDFQWNEDDELTLSDFKRLKSDFLKKIELIPILDPELYSQQSVDAQEDRYRYFRDLYYTVSCKFFSIGLYNTITAPSSSQEDAPTELLLITQDFNRDKDLFQVASYRLKKNSKLMVMSFDEYINTMETAKKISESNFFITIKKLSILHHSGRRELEHQLDIEEYLDKIQFIASTLPNVTTFVHRGCGMAEMPKSRELTKQKIQAQPLVKDSSEIQKLEEAIALLEIELSKDSPSLQQQKDLKHLEKCLQKEKSALGELESRQKAERDLARNPHTIFNTKKSKWEKIRQHTLDVTYEEGFSCATLFMQKIINALKSGGLGCNQPQISFKYYVAGYEGSDQGAQGLETPETMNAPKAIRMQIK